GCHRQLCFLAFRRFERPPQNLIWQLRHHITLAIKEGFATRTCPRLRCRARKLLLFATVPVVLCQHTPHASYFRSKFGRRCAASYSFARHAYNGVRITSFSVRSSSHKQ